MLQISHGDIKSENVLVTSWNWVYLSDLASAFKPTYLPEDDPSDFSYFFDTSGRRTCYVAPERFYTSDSEISRKKAGLEFGRSLGRVTEAMDVFGLGCVIAELFVEGTPPFTLSQLFKYRSGEYNLDAYLDQIEDEGIKALVKSMIALAPKERLSCEQYLSDAYGSTFPASFYDHFHDFVASSNDISSTYHTVSNVARSSTTGSVTGISTSQAGQPQLIQDPLSQFPLPSNADEIIASIWTEYESMERHFIPRNETTTSGLDNSSQEQLVAIDVGGKLFFQFRSSSLG